MLSVLFALLGAVHVPPSATTPTVPGDREALAAWREGRYQDALAIYRKSLDDLPAGSLAAAPIVANMAELQRALGQYREAERSARRALRMLEQTRGPRHPDVAAALNNLGEVLRAQGRSRAAEKTYRSALEIVEGAADPDLQTKARILGNLGQSLTEQRRHEDAERTLRLALASWERSGDRGPDYAVALNNLAVLLRLRGRLDEAGTLYERVLRECERTLGPDHLNSALVAINLADLRRLQKRYDESQALFDRGLPIAKAWLGPAHPELAGVLGLYSALLRDTGRRSEAKRLTGEAREIRAEHGRVDGSASVVNAKDLSLR